MYTYIHTYIGEEWRMTRVLQLVRSKVSPRGCRNVDEKQEGEKDGSPSSEPWAL